jgi:hypothetical protein
MNGKFSNAKCHVHTFNICYGYAKRSVGALISSILERYMMSEARFGNDDSNGD